MNTLVIIPVCNFYELLNKIIDFYTINLDEADIIIVDDSNSSALSSFVLNTRRKILMTLNTKHGYLGQAFLDGLFVAETEYNKKYDLVITNEHDVIPNVEALYACLHIFRSVNERKEVASVSTIYKYNNFMCYPSHPNWNKGITIFKDNLCGEVKYVGRQGVPFGFTLWKRIVFDEFDLSKLPPIWKLDSAFGRLLEEKGYHHLRLIDFYVEHYKRGIKSWKTVR